MNELLAELGASSPTEVTIDIVVGHTVNTTGLSPGAQPFKFQAIRGGTRIGIDEGLAIALRRQGAKTDVPGLQSIEPD